jgi:hypothetical protein
MMAVHKAKRSNPSAQPQRRRSNQPNPQSKPRLFDVLHHLNRGYGIALTNLGILERNEDFRLFPRRCLRNLRHHTEELRALANHELLQIMAGREERDARHFARLKERV